MSSCATDLDALQGLERAKRAVARVLSAGSASHALLLYGPEGAGKSRLADYLSQAWLCQNPREDGGPCGECSVCASFGRGRAVDFQRIPPWGPASQIKLSAMHPVPGWEQDTDRPDIEFVLDFIRTRPLMARHKVIVFERAERLNYDTANCLLKTLEEPPEGVRLILTTSEFTRVSPTIRSRCLCLACELPADQGVTSAQADRTPVESVFGGSPGGVARVLENREVYEDLLSLLEGAWQGPFGAAFRVAERCKAIADRLAKALDLNAREAHTRTIEAVAAWAHSRAADRPYVLRSIAEAHRLVQGNANATLVYEKMFLDLLYHR
ncbi:MAG TPA: ATP-binding protein [Fimbriimonadaceae bacterium]|nr:ATP-binding protein [Fimbriimonadaceae bacterium]